MFKQIGFDRAFTKRGSGMVLKFPHAVIAGVAVNGAVFPDRFPLPAGEFASADRTGNQGTEYVYISGRTP